MEREEKEMKVVERESDDGDKIKKNENKEA